MPMILTDNKHYTDIADKLRSNLGSEGTFLPEEIPSAVDAVYEKGKKDNLTELFDGFSGTFGMGCFSGKGWNDKTFIPTKNLVFASDARSSFAETQITDFVAQLEINNVTLDTSRATYVSYLFYYNPNLTRLPTIDLSNATDTGYCIYYCKKLTKIEKVIFSKNTTIAGTLLYANDALEECIFEGEIAKSGLNIKGSKKLNKESITSLINCLSSSTSGRSVTISKTAVKNAFPTSVDAEGNIIEENTDGTLTEWGELIATKSNWTISLA